MFTLYLLYVIFIYVYFILIICDFSACERYPFLLLLLEEVLQNCTSASASAAEIDDELRLNKFSHAVEAQFKDCQSRLAAVAYTQNRN